MTLYEITFGKYPPTIPQYIVGTSNIDVVDELLVNREEMFASLRKKLLKARTNFNCHLTPTFIPCSTALFSSHIPSGP